jgi:hypothetical protein
MSAELSFGVLLISPAEYRVDGAFRYSGELPEAGDLITVLDRLGGPERAARVRRVDPEEQFPIHATELTSPPLDSRVGPRERSRRTGNADRARVLNGRRGWLSRRRRRRRH